MEFNVSRLSVSRPEDDLICRMLELGHRYGCDPGEFAITIRISETSRVVLKTTLYDVDEPEQDRIDAEGDVTFTYDWLGVDFRIDEPTVARAVEVLVEKVDALLAEGARFSTKRKFEMIEDVFGPNDDPIIIVSWWDPLFTDAADIEAQRSTYAFMMKTYC